MARTLREKLIYTLEHWKGFEVDPEKHTARFVIMRPSVKRYGPEARKTHLRYFVGKNGAFRVSRQGTVTTARSAPKLSADLLQAYDSNLFQGRWPATPKYLIGNRNTRLFWNVEANDWVGRPVATEYTESERYTLQLPEDGICVWVRIKS